jgi:sugar lactone lactonase YvrE
MTGAARLYRLVNAAALPAWHDVPGYWIEETPAVPQIDLPTQPRDAWVVYHPRGLSVSPDGRVAVVEEATQSVVTFDTNGQIVHILSGVFVYPSDTGFFSDGSLVVVDANEGMLWFDRDGQLSRRIQSLSSPRGMFVAPDGNLYVADTGNARLVVVTPEGEIMRIIANTDKFPQPTSVAVAVDGRLAVGDPVAGRVLVLDPDGNVQAEYPVSIGDTSDDKPGVAWLPDGGLVYTDPVGGRVVWLDSSGQVIKEWTDLLRPNDVALTPDGRLLLQEGLGDRITLVALTTP